MAAGAGSGGGHQRGRDLPVIKGRGTNVSPAGRFERYAFEVDPESIDPDGPGPATELIDDPSRSIVSTNNSPDVGFDASVNPYRGCEHGCVYCVDGDTPVLMADGATKPMAAIEPGDAIIGTNRDGWYRRYVEASVTDHWRTTKAAHRVTLADGTELIAGADHRFLTLRGWKFVTGRSQGAGRRPHLTANDKLLGTGRFSNRPGGGEDYRLGYLAGLIRGDGRLASYHYEREGRAHGDQHQFRLALADDEALDRAASFLREFGVATIHFGLSAATEARRRIDAIRTSSRDLVDRIRRLIEWPAEPTPAWSTGFLAGIFDAEGSYSGGILRFSNTDPRIIDATRRGLSRLGLPYVVEDVRREQGRQARGPLRVVRVRGGLKSALAFFHATGPAIRRKQVIAGKALKSSAPLGVVSIEPLGRRELFDVTTTTGDFIADGVVSHNCYARPTHEYLGYSAGLDFETKILVKRDAPALLRKTLSSPRWRPRLVAMSGVTDPYQPAERKLRITRGCLEVLRDFRNPVGVITKNHLVTRDADVLAGLAVHGAAGVYLSVTTLDRSLQRAMEPRTSSPERRLEAIRRLAAAGVPVGVMVAPVIPGLTDHEVPAIVDAAADAGARSAGWIMLRLPHGVKELFEDWLEAHLPDRKARVLNRIREVRDGVLNDPKFGRRQRGTGQYAQQIGALFDAAVRKAGLPGMPDLSAAAFRVPDPAGQLGLFGA
ncbi:MAG: PA0069 family radical SAM protein [Gemmatimonadota bacterium]